MKPKRKVSVFQGKIINATHLVYVISNSIKDYDTSEFQKLCQLEGIGNGFRVAADILKATSYDGERCAKLLDEAANIIRDAFDSAFDK